MKIPFIDLKSQYRAIEPKIQARINSVLEHGQYIMGPEIFELEERLAKYVGSKYCISVSSGTDALLISLMALGIKPGDEIITTPFSFIATAEVIVQLGAIPVFVDIDSGSCNIDVGQIEEKISSKTKAIIPVSLYGQPADMSEICQIASKYGGIPVIEDAAQSFGARYKNLRSCNLSTMGCTSFFPSKPLGCYGDGGAIFTNDEYLAKACTEIRIHGQSQRYIHTRIGVGGRLDTLQAAILLAKLDTFDAELTARENIASQYDRELDSLKIPRILIKDDRTSVYAQYTTFVQNRNRVISRLTEVGIPTAVHYPMPINRQPAYSNYDKDSCETAYEISNSVLSLPMSPWMTSNQVSMVVEALKSAIE